MHRFQIAISFSGHYRDFVREVDRCLLQHFDRQTVFYDERYKALMGRPSLDRWLERLFSQHAELVVIFMSEEANQSMWCLAEKRAIEQTITSGGFARDPMLFTTGNLNVSGGLRQDWAIPTEGCTPQDVAAMIVQRYRAECPRVVLRTPDKPQRRVRIQIGMAVTILLAAIVANAIYDGRGGEDYAGVIGMVAVIGLLAGVILHVAGRMLAPTSTPTYEEEPDGASLPPDTRDGWKAYAKGLEMKYAAELAASKARIDRIRCARLLLLNSLVFSIVLGVAHCVAELAIRHSDPRSFLLNSSGTADFRWNVYTVFSEYHGHLWMLAGYFLFTSFVAFWVGNRLRGRWSVAFMVGACPSLYIGIFYLLFVVSRNYEAFFGGGGGSQGFYQEIGNFYVLERLVIVPAICFVGALLAVEFGKMARRRITV